jgi:hypothetical protein
LNSNQQVNVLGFAYVLSSLLNSFAFAITISRTSSEVLSVPEFGLFAAEAGLFDHFILVGFI